MGRSCAETSAGRYVAYKNETRSISRYIPVRAGSRRCLDSCCAARGSISGCEHASVASVDSAACTSEVSLVATARERRPTSLNSRSQSVCDKVYIYWTFFYFFQIRWMIFGNVSRVA